MNNEEKNAECFQTEIMWSLIPCIRARHDPNFGMICRGISHPIPNLFVQLFPNQVGSGKLEKFIIERL